MMSNRFFRLALLGLTVLLMAGCSAVNRPTPPQVQLVGLEMEELTLTHANMLAKVRLRNPNNFALDVRGIRVQLALNEVQVAKGNAIGPVKIAGGQSGDMLVQVATPLWAFFNLANNLQGSNEVRFKLVGDVDIGGWGVIGGNLPFSHSGVIPLQGTIPR